MHSKSADRDWPCTGIFAHPMPNWRAWHPMLRRVNPMIIHVAGNTVVTFQSLWDNNI
jgi:hypothetical protein